MPQSCSCQWVTLCDKLAKTELSKHCHFPPLMQEPRRVPASLLLQIMPKINNRALCTENSDQRPTACYLHGSAMLFRDVVPQCLHLSNKNIKIPLLPLKNSLKTTPYSRGPQPPGRLAVPVATQQESERSFICCSPLLPIARITAWTILHPQPTPTPRPSVEKLSSTKLVPGAKKVGDHCRVGFQAPGRR